MMDTYRALCLLDEQLSPAERQWFYRLPKDRREGFVEEFCVGKQTLDDMVATARNQFEMSRKKGRPMLGDSKLLMIAFRVTPEQYEWFNNLGRGKSQKLRDIIQLEKDIEEEARKRKEMES